MFSRCTILCWKWSMFFLCTQKMSKVEIKYMYKDFAERFNPYQLKEMTFSQSKNYFRQYLSRNLINRMQTILLCMVFYFSKLWYLLIIKYYWKHWKRKVLQWTQSSEKEKHCVYHWSSLHDFLIENENNSFVRWWSKFKGTELFFMFWK